ncbi:phosphotransferase [Aestuariibacter halophilus]|uniref:Phosphotransferase n=1 Tax=Fluctibacter halophilus TaxID=226011 RepID=A0ABS8GDZ3_9ALTE|nr:phosphotransferase [Aestuariibacter halophilus]MCC2618120.1 phosphotransferase [Aestuariibacter halophilus]
MLSKATLDHLSRQLGPLRYLETVQSLWSGYGEIARIALLDPAHHLIVKSVTPPTQVQHPRGWNNPTGHQRKLRSYQVELAFYQHYARRCDEDCPVASVRYVGQGPEGDLLVMADLDQQGYGLRTLNPTAAQIRAGLVWLAEFHGTFFADTGSKLWPQGNYWHLATRPDEYQAMSDGPLKQAAQALNAALQACPYQTLLHGDAKVANLCFGADDAVAAVDFQYVGPGPGCTDVMYFLSSCLDGADLAQQAQGWETVYFKQLSAALARRHPQVDGDAVVQAWQTLMPIAWADFARFLAGWSPSHPKCHDYLAAQTARALSML